MKAKIRPHNMSADFLATLDKEARAYFFERVDEYSKRLQAMFAQRWIAGTLLAANDQHGFGPKRGKDLVDGIIEIITGNCDDVYDRNEIEEPGTDKAFRKMQEELADRGIHLVITVNGAEVRATVDSKKKEKP